MCKTGTIVLEELTFPYSTEYHVCAKFVTFRVKDRLTESLRPCACVLFLWCVLQALTSSGETWYECHAIGDLLVSKLLTHNY
jgi:hypothetical protein